MREIMRQMVAERGAKRRERWPQLLKLFAPRG